MLITYSLIIISAVMTLLGLNTFILKSLHLNIPLALVLILISSILLAVGDVEYTGIVINYYMLFLLLMSLIYLVKRRKPMSYLSSIIMSVFIGGMLLLLRYLDTGSDLINSILLVGVLSLLAFVLNRDMEQMLIVIPLSMLIYELLYYYMIDRGDIIYIGGNYNAQFAYISITLAIIYRFIAIRLSKHRNTEELTFEAGDIDPRV